MAKGFLREFFRRPSTPTLQKADTYARSCAWALSVEIKARAEQRRGHLKLHVGETAMTITSDDLAAILYGLEGIDAPEKLRRAQRKSAVKKRFLAEG